MKKSKVIFVAALSLLLCLVCVSTPTFSWFTRPQILKGDSLGLDKGDSLGWDIDYELTDGENISMSTYVSADGGKTYDENVPVTSFSNTAGLAGGERVCYRTDITNSGAVPQSVSLYLSALDFPGGEQNNFYLGVNGPLRTFKNYGKNVSGGSGTSEKASNGTMRVYFQPKSSMMGEPDVNWKNKNYYVCYGVNQTPNTYVSLQSTMTSYTYYAEIPSSATQLFFSVQDWNANCQRTQTFTDLKSDGQSATNNLVFYLTGNYTGGDGYAYAEKSTVYYGANITSYYSEINVSEGGSFSAALALGSDYIGNMISYSSSNSGIFTVDGSGNITAKSPGTATLTTTATGVFGDSYSVTTTVTVAKKLTLSLTDIPVVTNVKVEGMNEDGEAGTQSVYWYIKNTAAEPLKYNIEELYLTL